MRLRIGLDLDPDLGEHRLAGLLAMAGAGDFGRMGDRFAVADARLVDADGQVEIAQQPVLDDFQVQLAHAADQRLAGLLALGGPERRILPLHHLERFGQFLCVRSSFPARWPSR